MDFAGCVTNSDMPVLLTGETEGEFSFLKRLYGPFCCEYCLSLKNSVQFVELLIFYLCRAAMWARDSCWSTVHCALVCCGSQLASQYSEFTDSKVDAELSLVGLLTDLLVLAFVIPFDDCER